MRGTDDYRIYGNWDAEESKQVPRVGMVVAKVGGSMIGRITEVQWQDTPYTNSGKSVSRIQVRWRNGHLTQEASYRLYSPERMYEARLAEVHDLERRIQEGKEIPLEKPHAK